MNRAIVTALLLSGLCVGKAQDSISEYRNSVYIEVLGANGFYSLNYNRVLVRTAKGELHGNVGCSYVPDSYRGAYGSYLLGTTWLFRSVTNQFRPAIGVSFAHDIEFRFDGYAVHDHCPQPCARADYLIPTLNIGAEFRLGNRVTLLSKYYLMFWHRTDDTGINIQHWGGLQLRLHLA